MCQKATHLALDFDQESEAAKNTHTYCITQGHVFSHLPRDQLKSVQIDILNRLLNESLEP